MTRAMMTMIMMTMVVVMTMMLVMTMMMTVLVMTMMHFCHATPSSLYPYVIDGRSAHPPLIGKTTLTPNPEVVLLSPRSHTWLEANGFKYSSSPRLIPPRSQPLVPQGRIWLEA